MNSIDINTIDFEKAGGLIPAVVQNATSGRVLMLGYMNREALEQTTATGKVTFFSRAKGRLWVKGETSSNFLILKDMSLDCDRDAVLILADPVGPTCHRGCESCFNEAEHSLNFLSELERIIAEHSLMSPEESYTARLFAAGTKRIAQKVGEEGLETALAATVHDRRETIDEASDLMYHLLVLLKKEGLSLADIAQNLKKRHEK